jgi:amino acid adenylation domain-containing protein
LTVADTRWNAVRTLLRSRADDPPLAPAPRDRELPASFAQEGLWLLDRLQPGGAAYNLAVACRIGGALDVPALARSLGEVVRRHEVLRTTLHLVEGRLVQRIGEAAAQALVPDDLDAGELEAWIHACADMPFDLGGSLLRVALARLGAADHCLLLVVHHAAFDAWSFELLLGELAALYDAYRSGRASPLAAPALQYADYAVWQRQRLDGSARAALVDYWREALRDAPPPLELLADRPRRPSRALRRGASHTAVLSRSLADALESLAARQDATLYMVLLAAFQLLLMRHSGAADVVVGTPVAGRARAGLDGVIGLFSNIVPLRVDVGGDPTFRELLARVVAAASGALAHHELPFELLVTELRLPRYADRAPLFEVLFALQNVPRAQPTWPGLAVELRYVPATQAKSDLALTMQQTARGLRALVEYDADRFDGETIAAMLEQLTTLLGAIVQDPEQRVGALPLLLPAQRQEMVTRWNDTATDYPRDTAVHRIFEEQVRRSPGAPAVVGTDETLTYAALDRRANQLARRLAALALGDEALVGVVLERSASSIAAELAVLKGGGAYVPLDATMPRARVAQLLGRAAAVVTSSTHAEWVSQLGLPLVLVDDRALADEPDSPLDMPVAAERLAYVMFTSGSTGTPRGVCVPHRGIVRLVHGADYARFAPDEVFLQLAPVSFDASTFEIWGALLHGGTLVMAPPGPLGLAEIAALVRRHAVTTLWLTSGLFELLVEERLDALPSLRQLLTGGDVLSAAHAEEFVARNPECRLIHCYGPTENSTFTTTHAVERGDRGQTIPIGRPIANSTVHVLDDRREPVPIGVAGEAWVGGDGVARGYFDDAAATRERFVADPFRDGGRLYRTGDRVRRRRDGALEFLGRLDEQVKLRGVRVEPAEVAHVLRQCPAVRAAAVVVERAAGDKRLVAYVVACDREGQGANPAQLRAFVRARLPDAMVPAAFVLVDRLPLTANGKLDRGALALAAPTPPMTTTPTSRAAPRSALEATLVALFVRALDGRVVGVDDSFFDAGGDSLAAMRLTVEIECELGAELPLATLFAHPTVAGLASQLARRAERRVHRASLVAIKEGQSARPLFLMAGGHGGRTELALYAKLVGRLATDETVFGMTVPADGQTVEEIAARHLDVIREAQPRGPYRVGGECVGGVVAYEVARQLAAAGESIALVLLIDSWVPTGVGVMHHQLIGQPLDLLALGLRFVADLPRRPPSAEPWWAELWRRANVPPDGRRYVRACMQYRPAAYAGGLTLLASDANLRRGIAQPWQRLAGGAVAIHRAPGNHQTYSRQHAEATAAILRRCLEEAAAKESA